MRYIDQCSVTMTCQQFPDHPPRLGAEIPPFPCIWDGHVVVPHVGWPQHPGMLHETREVLLAQKTEDAIGLPFVVTSRHENPIPAKVYEINY